MAKVFNYRQYTNNGPRLVFNCRYLEGNIVPDDDMTEASLVIDEPTLHYKTEKIQCPDQIWTWVPAAHSWLRNRDRVFGEVLPEEEEIYRYIRLHDELTELREQIVLQGQVNEYITHTDSWGDFPKMRSMNIHDPQWGEIPGITPRHYAIISQLGIVHGAGHPLTDHRPY